MSSSLRVNTIVPSTGTNVAIGTANGTVTFTDSVNFVLGTGSSIFSPAFKYADVWNELCLNTTCYRRCAGADQCNNRCSKHQFC